MSEIIVRRGSPGILSVETHRADQRPAPVYLSRLTARSRRVQRQALDVMAAVLSNGTSDSYDLPWQELRYQHTAALRAMLADRYAPATANRALSALRAVLKEAWRLGMMTAEDYHRAADLKNVRGERLPAGRALSQPEWTRMFKSCAADPIPARGARDAALIAILYGGGLRREEAAGLFLGDYDRTNGTLRVRGKGNKERLTPLIEGSEEYIRRWIEYRGDVRGALICPVGKSGVVTLRPITGQAVYGIVTRRAEEAGIEEFSPHDARRTFISDLLDAGADLSTVQRMAGHADVTTTARYDRRGEETKRRAAALIRMPGDTDSGI